MAKKQDFFAERVNRFVAIGPCIFTYGHPLTFRQEVGRILYLSDKLGVEHFGGGDNKGNGNAMGEIICDKIPNLCRYITVREDSGFSMGSLEYFAQLAQSKRF